MEASLVTSQIIRQGNSIWLLAADRDRARRSTGNQIMILSGEEIAFLDVYCHEGSHSRSLSPQEPKASSVRQASPRRAAGRRSNASAHPADRRRPPSD